MIIIGIDPGATIGLCVYDTTAGKVLYSGQYRDAAEKMAIEAGYRLSPVGLRGEVEGE